MSPINLLLNVLWVVTGGIWMAVGWLIAALIMALTIIGLPWARAAFNIASYTLLPFGRAAVDRDAYAGRNDLGTGPLGLIGNLIWLVLAGWWLALGHLITAFGLALTIIGLPFAWAHLKLAGISLWPIGKVIVDREAISCPGEASRGGTCGRGSCRARYRIRTGRLAATPDRSLDIAGPAHIYRAFLSLNDPRRARSFRWRQRPARASQESGKG